ncbi:MAG: Solvent efflux pump periplasmic linker SrpA [Verrucomicrobiae bacterium]|nr:Solvent efflux pump periplasmic linker SrpA [Verrucomicrobiae bacterium]
MIKITAGLMAVVLGALGCGKPAPNASRPAAKPYLVEVITVTRQPFRETLFATGSLRAKESVELPAQRAGVVKEVRFEEGQPVKAGDALVIMDASELQAQHKRAQAQYELATTVEKRNRQLLDNGALVTEAVYDESRASLNVARAELDLIRAQLEKTQIVAPFAGVAGLRRVSVGAFLTPGMPVAGLQDVSELKLDFAVPERYLPYLRAAKQVEFRVAGHAAAKPATIYAIEPAIDVTTRSLQVRALARNDDQLLLPGSFAEVHVALDEIPDAILIPPIALIPGLKEQRVFLHKAGTVEARTVQVGLRTSRALQIVAGLEPGEEVIVTGILQLRPGMKVQAKRAQP